LPATWARDPEGFALQSHPDCIACRSREEGGLGLRFRACPDGSILAEFRCESDYQGFPGRLHGGIIALLLDSAMTHCLFTRRERGVTARLQVRYLHPVHVQRNATIRAWLVHARRSLHILKAEILQEGDVCATAEASFLPEPGSG